MNRVRTLVVMCGGLLLGGVAAAEPVVYFFDEPRELAAWTGRVAVLAEDQPRGVVEALVAASVPGARVEPHALGGWYFVESAEARTPEATRAVAAALARQAAAREVFVSDVFVDNLGGPMFASPWVMVRFRDGVGAAEALAVLEASGFGLDVEQDFGGMAGAYRARTSLGSGLGVIEAAAALARRDDTIFAEPDMIFTGASALVPNDPGFPDCWGLDNTGQFGGTPGIDMRAVAAWDISIGDDSVQTLIIDTGVQQDHPDINQSAGFDATGADGGGGPMNRCDVHGTPVAGAVSAIINNGIGTVGIAPGTRTRSARAMVSSQACNGSWNSAASWTVSALNWGASVGARVSNNSNAYGFTSSAIAAAYEATRIDGMIHFASAGNNGSSQLSYPSNLPTVNAIGAIAPDGSPAFFTNFGVGLWQVAPGVDVYSTDRTGSDGYVEGDYVFISGTSFSAPYAAGVAALVLSVNPDLTPDEVEAVLAGTARDLGTPGYDTIFGWGVPRANAALEEVAPPCAGDLNADGVVNADDLGVLLDGFGCAGVCAADLDGDGVVNADDLGVLLNDFGCEG